MAEIVDQILSELRARAEKLYPERGEFKATRLVGHTPKQDHFIYDAVMEFANGSERISCKVYRGKTQNAKAIAAQEYDNLSYVYETFAKKRLRGVPRPLGDFSQLGAVVAEKITGLPLQSIIMKAALLPGYADRAGLDRASTAAGEWLHEFHKATAHRTVAFDQARLLSDLENLCVSCKTEGLEDRDIQMILTGAKHMLGKVKKSVLVSAVLNEFTPLNVNVTDGGVAICGFEKMSKTGTALDDVAHFMACIEALEKYPFCNREITSEIQETFLNAYGVTPSERALVRVLKMKALLKMFAAGRNTRDTALRKRVMWANVMKRFIHQAANRTLNSAA